MAVTEDFFNKFLISQKKEERKAGDFDLGSNKSNLNPITAAAQFLSKPGYHPSTAASLLSEYKLAASFPLSSRKLYFLLLHNFVFPNIELRFTNLLILRLTGGSTDATLSPGETVSVCIHFFFFLNKYFCIKSNHFVNVCRIIWKVSVRNGARKSILNFWTLMR